MALIDDLIQHITDSALRAELSAAVRELRKKQRFGLVFEAHIPETVALRGLPLSVGSVVRLRTAPDSDTLYQVLAVTPTLATVQNLTDGSKLDVSERNLLVVKRFGDPIYPSLTSVSSLTQGLANRPYHAMIEGENFHVLQLLVYLYEGKVDCIYIDPPYNSGARDWKYNNRYVDKNDTYRHSKWLSFMQKRLALAKRLLSDDGVLVVTIDKNEHYHLGMLLEKEFRDYDLTSVAIVQNPRGAQGDNFSHTNEFAVFVVPNGRKIITDRVLPSEEWDTSPLRNWGGESLRTDARNCFYPIFVRDNAIVGFGEVADDGLHPASAVVNKGDHLEYWPIDNQGVERKWRYARQSVEAIEAQLSVKQGRDGTQIVITKTTGKHKTVWYGPRYDANKYGTQLVRDLTGTEFPYPKSVLAVRDTLYACIGKKPDALILDFFAGSGTTFHATCMLNAEDGGARRCVLVTNNEVGEKQAKSLYGQGLYPGDKDFEKHGIFENVMAPRCQAALLGKRPDGSSIPGDLEGRLISQGFQENVEFFHLGYVDPDQVDLGTQYEAILPALWLAAGGIGPREARNNKHYSMPEGASYAVLFDEKYYSGFLDALTGRNDIRKAWLVTDSEEAFVEMRSGLPHNVEASMLYRDYLRTFRINTRMMT